MLTAKENMRQTIIPGGQPDRFVNNYEGLCFLFNPHLLHSGGSLTPKGVMNAKSAWGVTFSYPEYTPGAFPIHGPGLTVVENIENWRDYVKMPQMDWPEEEWEQCIAGAEAVDTDKAFKTIIMAPGIFEQSHYLCGLDNALIYFMENPKEMHELLKYITEFELRAAEDICSKMKPEVIFHHDDFGTETNSMMPPEYYGEFLVEPYKEIYGYYKDHGCEFVIHHNDSWSANLVPYMIEMGIDVWQGAMEKNDVKDLISKYGDKISFMGNIDNKDIDFEGWTPEDCYRVAREHCEGYEFQSYLPCITQGGPGSTYPGNYLELCKGIDMYNSEHFGFSMEELADARMELQVLFE